MGCCLCLITFEFHSRNYNLVTHGMKSCLLLKSAFGVHQIGNRHFSSKSRTVVFPEILFFSEVMNGFANEHISDISLWRR